MTTTQWQPLGSGARKFPLKKQLAGYWGLIEMAPMTEEHKIILKPAIPMMSWILLNQRAQKEGHAQKSPIVKRKWFIEEHATRGM